MRGFRKILIAVIVLAGIMLVTAAVLGRMFEDELSQFVIGSLNKHLRAEVKVADVKLSFIKKFPNASLELREVYMASVPDLNPSDFEEGDLDTLLACKKMLLRFNLPKLLNQEYLIREIQFSSGKLNLCIDREGKGNYRFWKGKTSESKDDFLVEMDNVRMNNISIGLNNRALNINFKGDLQKSTFRGQFSSESFILSSGIHGTVRNYSNAGGVLIKDSELNLDAAMRIDPQSIRIEGAELLLAGQRLRVWGTIQKPEPLDLDLGFEAERLDLESLLRFAVMLGNPYPEEIRAGGEVSLKGTVTGGLSNTRMPRIVAGFVLRNGWINHPDMPREIKDIRTEGEYSNGVLLGPESTSIRLKNLSMQFGRTRLGGDYSVSNLVNPDFDYKIKAELDLSDLSYFLSVDTLFREITGRVLAEINMRGSRNLLKEFNKTDLLDYHYSAKLILEDVSLRFRKLPLDFTHFTGNAGFTDHLILKNFSGKYQDSRVSFSGRLDNFLEYLFTPGAKLWIDADVYSEEMDLNHLRAFRYDAEEKKTSDTIYFPQRLNLKARFWFDEIDIKDFHADQVTGNLVYKPRRISLNRLELLSMNGRIVTEGILEQHQDMNFFIKSLSRINSVEISEAFSSFDNFGQDFILDKNLKGSLSGAVNFSAGLNESLKIKKESILADCNVHIDNGELTGFEPVMELSRYIEVEELENIRFSTLTNEIFIRNQEVVIPKMDIHSSAFDITASGIHGMNGEFNYRIRVALSELLAEKSRKPSEQESEFGIIEDDGLGKVYLYLIFAGDSKESRIRYDRKGAVENRREQMKEEKKKLREILNDEFGLFKKDTLPEEVSPGQHRPGFIIEWDENGDSTVKEGPGKGNKQEEERFIIEWDEDKQADTLTTENKRRIRRRKK